MARDGPRADMASAAVSKHRTVIGRYGFIISALLVFAIGIAFSFQNLFEQKRLIEKESRINVWFLAQTEIEYIRLLDALALFAVEGSNVGHDALMLRFDIFWSRLPVLLEGPQTAALRAIPGFQGKVSELLATLREIEPAIVGLTEADRTTLFQVRSVLERWQTPLHQLVIDALTYESTATASARKNAESLYYELMGYFVAAFAGIAVLFLALYRQIRRANEAESHASAARSQLVEAIESISEAFVLFDDEDRIVLYNSKYKSFHPGFADLVKPGARFEDLIRTAAERGGVSVSDGSVDAWVRRSLAQHRNPGAPLESQLVDGRWLKISERKTKDGWIVGVHTDITELKRREMELREKSTLLEVTLENTNQGISVFDAHLRLLAWNRVYVDMFGFPPELVAVGRPYEDIIRHNIEQGEYGRGSAALLHDHLSLAREIARSVTGRKRIERKRPNGATIELCYNALPSGGFVKTYTDLTERARAEEERARLLEQVHASQEENLRLMMEREAAQRRSAEMRLIDAIESSSEAVILLDAEGRIVTVNTQARKFFPQVADVMVADTPYVTVLMEAAKRGVYSRPKQIARGVDKRKGGLKTAHTVAEEQLADGRWLRESRSGTQDGGSVVIWSDITEMKHREQNLQAAKEQAEAASASKTNFLANMAHELRTPLNAINGFSQMIAEEIIGPISEPRYRDYARDILESGNHLLDIINDILNIAKSEAGKLRLNLEDVDPVAVVETCRKIIQERCDKALIQLVVNQPVRPPRIRADAAKLRQIILNVLSNGVKFTPARGRVTLTVGEAAEGGLLIVVADTGIGMRPEDIPTALEPFGQIDNSLARKYEGTGLGLPLTNALVKLHGGTMTINTRLGEGAKVTICLPLEPPAAPAPITAREQASTPPREGSRDDASLTPGFDVTHPLRVNAR